MSPELTYFLKVNVALILFYAFYRLFFYKDTFFQWRRLALIGFFLVSTLYPMMNIEEWIKESEPMVGMADLYATMVLPEVTVGMQAETQAIDWQNLLFSSFGYIYWGVLALLFIRFLVQLFSILKLAMRCRKTTIENTQVYLLDRPIGPFSFFRWIFVDQESHTENELKEILMHEQAHVRQWHSIDVVFSELACAVCWFNPFAWLLKREIRCNLEYMADNQVLESGHDSQTYQYHLLGLTHQTKAAATLYNSFNVLPLKNRIKMMNKKRSKAIGRTKYLLFLPLAALLLIVSNIESVARTTMRIANEMLPDPVLSSETSRSFEEPTDYANNVPEPKAVSKTEVVNPKDSLKKEDKELVFMVVEQMPEYPGGQQALMNFLRQNVKYPANAKEHQIQGRVIAQFIVEKDGSISDRHIVRSVSPELDAEAMRVMSIMPKWEPGKQRGENVRVKYTIPISFNLDNEPKEIKDNNLPESVVVGYAPRKIEETTDQSAYQVVEEMPKFPGGQEALMRYIAMNVKYPVDAQRAKTQGRVILQMVIDEQGNVTSPSIIRSVSPSIDAEAIRVIMSMPQWLPGKNKGEAVKVKYTIPITFKLTPPDNNKKEANNK
nr:M56 family metallopeptidase [uncultured Bacteroides sp.]